MLRISIFFLCFQAWKLWNADNIVAFIDPMISEPCFETEILRSIHVGLLCVQEFAKDRPIVSLFPCLKVRLLIFLVQSSWHLLKGRLPQTESPLKAAKENSLLTMLLLQRYKVDSQHMLLTQSWFVYIFILDTFRRILYGVNT